MLDSGMIMQVMNKMKKESFKDSINIKFVHECIYYRMHPFVPLNHFVFEYYTENKSIFANYYNFYQVSGNIIWCAINQANLAIKTKNQKLFNQAIKVIENENYKIHKAYVNYLGDTVGYIVSPDILLSLQFSLFSTTHNSLKLLQIINKIDKYFANDWDALNEFAWQIYQQKNKDTFAIQQSFAWVKKSIKLNKNSYNLDTYASLLYYTNEYNQALNIAEEALEVAKTKGLSIKSTSQLIKKIKEKQSKSN